LAVAAVWAALVLPHPVDSVSEAGWVAVVRWAPLLSLRWVAAVLASAVGWVMVHLLAGWEACNNRVGWVEAWEGWAHLPVVMAVASPPGLRVAERLSKRVAEQASDRTDF
jgi:hypothetical protein